MQKTVQTFLTAAGTWTARPAAFGLVVVYVALWAICDRESFNFHGAIAVITLCMTLSIQRSEHRDTQTIQTKLDELIGTRTDVHQIFTLWMSKSRSKLAVYRAVRRRSL
jgi:low affinity Fe/Cu permease